MRKQLFIGLGLLLISISISSCSASFTTVASPKPTKKMLVTSGDIANKEYIVLGFIESTASTMGIGFPTETKISKMQSEALNEGMVTKAETIGADAIINVSLTTNLDSKYFIFLTTTIFVKGTAIKFK